MKPLYSFEIPETEIKMAISVVKVNSKFKKMSNQFSSKKIGYTIAKPSVEFEKIDWEIGIFLLHYSFQS